jgi:D-galactarolactone cycloisomerase
MEVSSVEAIPLAYPLEEGKGYGSARGTVGRRTSTLVRAVTRDGQVGWGEAFGPPRTTATLIDELLADVAVGCDPYEVEALCDRNYAGLYHFGSRGLIQSALSGIDIALWDLIGRSSGTAVSRLLGGRCRDEVRAYASTMYITQWGQDPAEPMEAAVADGFDAAKIKIGRGIEDDVERVRTAREILGEDADLMVDCNGNYRPQQAIRLGEAIEPYDVAWLEEPVPPENRSGYRDLKQAVNVPLAAGEASYARFEFKDLIEDRTVDVVEPDVCKCGGFSEARFIAKLATTENVAISPRRPRGESPTRRRTPGVPPLDDRARAAPVRGRQGRERPPRGPGDRPARSDGGPARSSRRAGDRRHRRPGRNRAVPDRRRDLIAARTRHPRTSLRGEPPPSAQVGRGRQVHDLAGQTGEHVHGQSHRSPRLRADRTARRGANRR